MKPGWKIALAAVAILVMIVLCSATCLSNTGSVNRGTTTEEVEDCDADDLIEGDEDCYGSNTKKKPTKKPRPRPRRS